MLAGFVTSIGASLVALGALAQDVPPAPSGAPAPPIAPAPVPATAPAETAPADAGRLKEIDGTFELRLQGGPVELTESRKILVRKRLLQTAQFVSPNVVQLSIEQRVADGVVVALEASGFVIDPVEGYIVTIGSTLEQAGRVAVHFANAPQLRPRRARLVGIDEKTDVGVLDIGAVPLPGLSLSAPAAPSAQQAPPGESRYVVTVSGRPDESESNVVAGWLHDPLRNPMLGQRRFDCLLHVTIARLPRCAGGVLAQQDGQVMGLILSPAQAAGASVAADGMLALPAEVLRHGVQAVLEHARTHGRGSEGATPGAIWASARPVRSWIGFGATDLDEPEFLRQLGVPRAVVVSEVFDESPALAAGIEPHDVILGWNGEPVPGVDALDAKLSASAPGREITLDCLRGLERRKVRVKLGAW